MQTSQKTVSTPPPAQPELTTALFGLEEAVSRASALLEMFSAKIAEEITESYNDTTGGFISGGVFFLTFDTVAALTRAYETLREAVYRAEGQH